MATPEHFESLVESREKGEKNELDDSQDVDLKSNLSRQMSNASTSRAVEQEFSCPVCLRLVILPTTLTCGHTSCRLCLAQWYCNSKKKECPLCRLPYGGHPKINTQIKNLVQTVLPDEVNEREREFNNDQGQQKTLESFEKMLSAEPSNVPKRVSDVMSFCSGIIAAISVITVAYLAWYWQSYDAGLLVTKPVHSWKPSDVASWMKELGWSAQYAPFVEENGIDGTMLLSIDQKGFEKYLNMSDSTHCRALMFAINILAETGLKPPATLWEFKAMYPGRALFLVYGLKDFPRTTILYLYMYFYDDLFLPFLQATTGLGGIQQYFGYLNDEPTLRQWVEFLVFAVLMPQWLVSVVAWHMFQHHLFTPCFVLAMALFYTALEALTCMDVISHSLNMVPWSTWSKNYFRQLISTFGFMILWPIIPSVICDSFFYGALYLGPLNAANTLFERFRLGPRNF